MSRSRSYGGYTLGELEHVCRQRLPPHTPQRDYEYVRAATAALPYLVARLNQLLEETNATDTIPDGS